MTRILCSYLFQCIVLLGTLYAQEVISWQDCIKRVLHNSPAIKQAQCDVREVQIEKNLSYGNYLPSLTFSASFSRNEQGPRQVWLGAASYKQPGDVYNYHYLSANLSYLLFDWGNSMRRYSYYTHSEQARKAALTATKRKVIIDTYKRYCQLLEARETLQLYEDEYENLKKQENIIANLVESGLRPEVDLNLIRVQCGNMDVKIETQKAMIHKYSSELAVLMGIEENQSFIPEPVSFSIEREMDTLSIEEDQLLLSSPEIAQLKYQREKEQKQLEIQKWDFLPDVYLNYAYHRSDQLLKEVYGHFKNNWYSYISLDFSFPLYRNNQNRLKYEQTVIHMQKLEESLREKRIAILNEVKKLIIDLEALNKNYIIYESNINYLKEIYNYESGKYQSGSGQFIDMFHALQSLISVKQTLINTKYGILRISFTLSTLRGEMDGL